MTSLANIDISEIKDTEGIIDISGQIDPEEKQAALLLREAGLVVKEPIAFEMKLEAKGYGILELSGWLQTSVRLQCCRCLEWFDYPLEKDFMIEYRPAAAEREMDHLEITEDDIYINNYTSNTLNILEEYCAQLILSLPMAPCCHKECKGLCLQCGQNLNIKECGCTVGGDSLTGLACLTSLNFKEEKDA